jgi:hypothetical protein
MYTIIFPPLTNRMPHTAKSAIPISITDTTVTSPIVTQFGIIAWFTHVNDTNAPCPSSRNVQPKPFSAQKKERVSSEAENERGTKDIREEEEKGTV